MSTKTNEKNQVERIAKVIWEAGEAPVPWSKLYENEKEEWRVMARAAIAALGSAEVVSDPTESEGKISNP